MTFRFTLPIKRVIGQFPIWILFILGMWLVVLLPLGPHLSLVPGDLGDARFNNYVLEHFFGWVTGQTRDYWNAPFFFPFPQTIAYSDNLLGSAPIYALLRWAGLKMVSAFQGWYLFGFLLNYLSASYVLSRLNFKPLAIGTGAFFFTFGLPLLAQESHAQLLYRFCIPLVCFLLWRFYETPRLKTLVSLFAFLAWQFYLTIYMGIFTLLLLFVFMILIPFFIPEKTIWQRLTVFPRRLIAAWSRSLPVERIFAVISFIVLSLGLVALLLPYVQVTQAYGFFRRPEVISTMLPRLQSYLLADNSQIWSSTAGIFSNLPMRHEHQLFPGLAVLLLVVVGIAGRFHFENSRMAYVHLGAVLATIALTLYVNGFSFYLLAAPLPGLNSIRAVTRIILVLMWPISLFIAWVIDGFVRTYNQNHRWLQAATYLVVVLLVAESVFYTHATYNKTDAQTRLDELRQKIPASVPENPILFVAWNDQEPRYVKEIDVMLLAQEMGWPTFNGYSGNSPPNYKAPDTCKQLPSRIKTYMKFSKISDPSYYLGIMNRVLLLDFFDCDPTWWKSMP